MRMRHSCRCGLHPVLTLLAMSLVGSVVGIGLHMWMEPWTSAVVVAAGSVAGLLVSHAFGESVLYGLVAGCAMAMLVLGIRGFASVIETVKRPPTMASSRAWFSR